MNQYIEQTLSSESIYQGKVFDIIRDKAKLIDGQERIREVVLHSGGVVVAAFTDDDHLFMVRQFRYPAREELIELPAGKLEPGEDPDDAIKRELEEECGCKAQHWEKLGCFFSTPGFCNEKLHLYKATGLISSQMNLDEGELLSSFTVPVKQAWQWVLEGKIKDMKSVALLGLIGANNF